jgi:hypothetical protein
LNNVLKLNVKEKDFPSTEQVIRELTMAVIQNPDFIIKKKPIEFTLGGIAVVVDTKSKMVSERRLAKHS